MKVWILSFPQDKYGNWVACGKTRDEAQYNYLLGIESGQFDRPRYRVIVRLK